MAGIVGLLVTSDEKESELMLQRMSEEIRHRRTESYHTMKHNQSQCMILGPRSFHGPDDDIFIVDINRDLDLSEETDDITSIAEISSVVTVILDKRGVHLLRTLDGTRAIYFGTTEDTFAFGTERKSLWSIGIMSAHAVEPGQGITYTWDGNLAKEQFASLEKPQPSQASREETLSLLELELLRSFHRLEEDTTCAVLFSGGVDSSLAAILTAKECEKTLLVSTRASGAHDESAAASAANLLGLPLFTVDLNPQLIWETLPEVIYSIETSNQMDVEIALPFFLAAKRAVEEGCTTVISGQGPDELFGGYAKHVKTFTEDGPETLVEQLWKEVSITHESNIERDDRAIAAHGVDSFFPYLDQRFVRAALAVPVEWKVDPKGTPQRKIIFRELAKQMGVPEQIADAPKNATQYSSGSSKSILESIIEHVDGFEGLSRKKAASRVQEVLNGIAHECDVPTH